VFLCVKKSIIFEKNTKNTVKFPRQDIPVIEKDKNWYKQHLDYAEGLLKNYSQVRARMSRLYLSYNGVKPPLSTSWLEKTYGKENRAKYIAYRLGRTKINLLQGEWLKRPLSATVQTINSEAQSEKMRQLNFMKGAMIAKPELEDIKNIAGVDVMEGAPIPDSESDPLWEKMSFKDKAEDIMQIILDEQTKSLGLKRKTGHMFLDLLITSMCYCKVELNHEGDVDLVVIDPRNAIYEHIDGDDFLQKSPIKGARQVLSVHEILRRYDLTDAQRDILEQARTNPGSYCGANGLGRGYMSNETGDLVCDVVHVEWMGVTPEYYKISPKTKSQMEIDMSDDKYILEIEPEKYEKAKAIHDKNVLKGEYEIRVKWREDWYEATRIGGLIDVNCRRKPFQRRSVDEPAYVLDCSYHGFVYGTVDGTRISVQQEIENFDNMFDICMYQILKELSRAKGKALAYDRAGLPEGETVERVMYKIENDQFIDYNSAAAGNFAGRNLDPASMFKEIDLGLSSSFEYLLRMKQDIMNNLNQITGINENREGNIAASSTVTNAQSAIANSRTITEALFYGMNEFVQILLQSVVEYSAISFAFYKSEKGEQILGTEKHKFLQVTKEVGYRNYGVHIEDGGRYMDIKQRMNQLAEFSLNAKEIRPMDVLKLQLAETTAEMKSVLTNSWIEMQKVIQESQERQLQAQNQAQQIQSQTQLQIAQENREDQQANEKDNIQLAQELKTEGQIKIDDNRAKNKMFENQQNIENNFLNEQ